MNTSYFNSYRSFTSTGDERLQTIQNLTGGSTNISKFAYTYNAVGTIASMTQTNDSSTAIVNTYGYDNADQLTGDTQSGGATSTYGYNYDFVGNRLAETINSTTTAGAFNNLNQLVRTGSGVATTIAGSVNKSVTLTIDGQPATLDGSNHFSLSLPLPGGTNTVPLTATDSLGNQTTNKYQFFTTGSTVTPTYDADGNMLTDENGNSYQWDAKNELTAIIYNSGPNSGNHTEFSYDALGHRIAIIERAGTTIGSGTVTSTKQFVWDNNSTAEERNVSNTVTKRFYAQGEQISGSNYYYTFDHLGNIREMTNSSGTIVARYDYDSYGRTTLISGTNLSDFQYAGYYAHQPSGLNLTLYRVYDPNTARWLSRDPEGEYFGINLYRYCNNNPMSLYDPFGLCPDLPDKWGYTWWDLNPLQLYVHGLYSVGWNLSNYVNQELSGLDADITLINDMNTNPLLDPNNPNYNPAIIQQDQMAGIQNAASATVAGTKVPGTSFTGDVQNSSEAIDYAASAALSATTDATADQAAESSSTNKDHK